MLKTFQRLGYFTPLQQLPATIVTHIAQTARLGRHKPLTWLRHLPCQIPANPCYIQRLRAYLQVRMTRVQTIRVRKRPADRIDDLTLTVAATALA